MKRLLLALFQIGLVLAAAVVVFSHDIHSPGEVLPFLAAIVLRGWLSKNIDDPLFGNESAQSWALKQLKRLAPKHQPKSEWDI